MKFTVTSEQTNNLCHFKTCCNREFDYELFASIMTKWEHAEGLENLNISWNRQ